MAALINAQLEIEVPAALSFEPLTIEELQRHLLAHHEHVLRSDLQWPWIVAPEQYLCEH